MKYYAKIGIDNEVVQVVVLSDDFSDSAGLQHIKDITNSDHWKQCNETVGQGDTWDKTKNAFIKQQPFPSWVLNADNIWEAPVEKPADKDNWNEDKQEWE
tara:strand:- start:429 stop:728 length:300 start_codon:yes stop_codon:yes gene_type:complete